MLPSLKDTLTICLRRRLGVKGLMLLLIVGTTLTHCQAQPQMPEDEEEEITDIPIRKHLAFRVTCGSPARGIIVRVEIFERETQNVVVSGSTSLDGSFCTIVKLDAEKWYKIQLYDMADNKCISWLRDISYVNYPWFWFDNCSEDFSNTTSHLGTCSNWEAVSGCWDG